MGTRRTPTARSANPRNCAHYADEPSGEVEVVCAGCLAERARAANEHIPRELRQTWLYPRQEVAP